MNTTTMIYAPKKIRQNYFIFSNGQFIKKEEIFDELKYPCKGEIFSKEDTVKIKININKNLAVFGDILVNDFPESGTYNAVLNELQLNYGVQIEGRVYHIKSIIDEEFAPIYGKVKFYQENVKNEISIERESWVTWIGTENPE